MKQMQNKYVCTFTVHIRHLHIIVIQFYNTSDTKDSGDIMHYFQKTKKKAINVTWIFFILTLILLMWRIG